MAKTPAQLEAEIAEALATTPASRLAASRSVRRSDEKILRVFRRLEPGRYHIEAGSHSWSVFRVKSEYGDFQWIIDRDDLPGFAQCDTLDCVRATIIAAVQAARHGGSSHG